MTIAKRVPWSLLRFWRAKVRLSSDIEVNPVGWLFKRVWDRLLPGLLLPTRLPYKGWWLAGNDLIDDLIFVGAYELREWQFVQRFLHEGMTVLDVGAHHGFYTVLGARRVGRSGRVIAFEPSPRERKRLTCHLRLNKVRECVNVYPLALSSTEGEATLFVDLEGRNTGHNSLRASAAAKPVKQMTVRTQTLDRFLEEHAINRVDFIKLDVEGAELEVLRGATSLLSRLPRPVIMAEVQDFTTAPWGYPARAVYDFLTGLGYLWFSVTARGTLQLSPPRDRYDKANNMVALPREMLSLATYLIEKIE